MPAGITTYSSFSSFDKSHHAERRMLGRYLEHFDDFLEFFNDGNSLLINQEDVTGAWNARFDSVVAALYWDVFPGMGVVLALLDDSEFGKDIKWFFSPQVVDLDFKLLLVHVENSMELILNAVQDPTSFQNMIDAQESDVPVVERGTVRSPSYCFNFEIGEIVPKSLETLVNFIDGVKHDPPFDTIFTEEPVFKKPIFCWQIINGIKGCISRDSACMGGSFQLHLNKPLTGAAAFSMRILAMTKIQLEILTTLLSKHLERESQ